jgi:hypothetical protein
VPADRYSHHTFPFLGTDGTFYLGHSFNFDSTVLYQVLVTDDGCYFLRDGGSSQLLQKHRMIVGRFRDLLSLTDPESLPEAA